MRSVLYITANKILDNSGDGVENFKIFKSLYDLHLKNKISLSLISQDKFSNQNEYHINYSFNVLPKLYKHVLARLFGYPSYIYMYYKHINRIIKDEQIDTIILSNSRLGFLIPFIKNNHNSIKIITQFHNAEYFNVNNVILKYIYILRPIIGFLEKKNVYNSEKTAVRISDCLLFLTKRDKVLIENEYGLNIPFEIIPLKLLDPIVLKTFKDDDNKKLRLLFTGSLDYGPNSVAIFWFIENVFKNFKDLEIELVIGGRNPSKKLYDKISHFKNIKLITNFNSFQELINYRTIFISPLFFGGGMKIKVAEALSHGLIVIGTTESFIGYDDVKEIQNKSILIEVNTANEFISEILNFYNDKSTTISPESIKLFKKYYSLNNFDLMDYEYFKKLLGNDCNK